MVNNVGLPTYGAGAPYSSSSRFSGNTVAALQGQIRQEQVQLNDWVTCVSAKTSKGQAAIQKLSGEIGGAKEKIDRTLQAQSGASSTTQAASAPDAGETKMPLSVVGGASRPGSVDVWA